VSRIPAERILLIQFRKIGDVLLNTPVVRALRQHYLQSYIAYCAEPGPAEVLKGNPMLDDILLYPRPATLRDAWRFIRRIREYGFDLVIDLMGNPRSALLSWMSGARHRVAFARWPRSLCYTMLVDHRHEVQEYIVKKRLRLLEPLGIYASDVSTTMTYTPQDRELVDHFLKGNGVKPDDLLICIDPTHKAVIGQWPGQRFSELADLLSEKLGAQICLLWGPGEKEYVAAIAAATRSKPILNPPWELSQVAALLHRSDLFVGCDSGPGHIAISQQTPTVTIFGYQRGTNWRPAEPQHRVVMLGLPCQPCHQKQCGPPLDIACLRTLPVEMVFEAVLASQPWVPKLQHPAPLPIHRDDAPGHHHTGP
jgi:ADP-heptose:LPS heptosyltransferase